MGISVLAAEMADPEGHPGVLLSEAQAAGTNDSAAMNELLRRYEPLIKSVARSMGRPDSMFDDLVNGGRWGLVQAVLHHDGRREGFTSYLKRYVRGEAERAVERQHFADVATPTEDMPVVESTIYVPEVAVEAAAVTFDCLSADQNLLVCARYRDDRSLKEIAGQTGCSVSAVSQRLRTIHNALARTLVTQAA